MRLILGRQICRAELRFYVTVKLTINPNFHMLIYYVETFKHFTHEVHK
jgi:hypothetical protein